MADVQTEDQAIDALMAAVAAPEQQNVTAADDDLEQSEDLDRETEAAAVAAPEQQPAKQAVDPDEDEIEIPGEDGKEPTRLKVADLVAKAQQLDAIESQKAQIIERVHQEAVEQATGQLRQVEQIGKQTAYMLQGALQLLQAPQPPNADAMLNPASPQYDPDNYHRQYASYQRATQQFQQAQALGGELMKQAQQASQHAQEQREGLELQRLQRVWPEFGQQETLNKFVTDMQSAYGFTPQELDAVLTDHRQAIVARDALAFRAMKAQSGDVKAKVEAKAPKLVRSKQEAKGTPAQQRDAKGKFVGDSLAQAKKLGTDDAWAAHFANLSRAGRF